MPGLTDTWPPSGPLTDGGTPLDAIPGIIAPNHPGLGPSTIALTANRGWLMRFVPPRDMKITTMRFAVTAAAGSDDQFDMGIYDAAGNRLTSTGAISGARLTSIGPKTANISPTVCAAGTPYFAAWAAGAIGTTAAQLMGLTGVSFAFMGLMTVLNNGVMDARTFGAMRDTIFPLPATTTLAGWALTGSAHPVVALME